MGELRDLIESIHRQGPIRPDGLVIDGKVVGLRDWGCTTCLTAWPCPTISLLDKQGDDLTAGVNGEGVSSYPPHGANAAPDEPKGAAPNAPAPVVTLPAMGGKPNMIMRSFRVPEKLWEAAKAAADEREENISDVLREALERYVKRR